MVPREALTSAIALNSMLWNGARVLGPLAAAAIIARSGLAVCFLLNALSFIAVLIALIRIDAAPAVLVHAERPSPLGGLRYVRENPVALRVLTLFAVTACFGWSYQTLLPAIAHDRFGRGADGVGALMAAAGVGAFIAALVTAAMGERYRRVLLYGGAFAYATSLALFAAVHSYAVALGVVSIVGFGLIVCGINVNAQLQEAVPDELRGRVMAIFSLLFMGLQPLGGLLAGMTAERVGTISTVRMAAAICLAAITAIFLWSQEERHAVRNARLEAALEAG
jgi:MFS family permease